MKPTSILLSILSFSATSVLATPPACLIAAVNIENNPSDLNTVCGSDAKKLQSAIQAKCSGGSMQSMAQSAFIATCSAAGKSVGE